MTSAASQPTCPSCTQSDEVRPMREAAAAKPQLGAPRSPRHHGRNLGCAPMLVSTLVAVTVAALLGSLVIAVGLDVPGRPDISVADAGVFSGILAFMVVFVAVFAVFVWRQARADVVLRHKIARWHRANERWEHLVYCARCDGAFAPGQSRLIPPDEVQAWLYEAERAPATVSAPAAQ